MDFSAKLKLVPHNQAQQSDDWAEELTIEEEQPLGTFQLGVANFLQMRRLSSERKLKKHCCLKLKNYCMDSSQTKAKMSSKELAWNWYCIFERLTD